MQGPFEIAALMLLKKTETRTTVAMSEGYLGN